MGIKINNLRKQMASPESIKEVVEKDQENRRYVDCWALRPQWASLTYGVFLCLDCAEVHRSMGVRISL